MDTRIYLTQDPSSHLRDGDRKVPAAPGAVPDELHSASLRLRALRAAGLGSVARDKFCAEVEATILPHVPARRRRSFRASLAALLDPDGAWVAGCRYLLGCPCIGSLSEGMVRILEEVSTRQGFYYTVYCLEGSPQENVAVLQMVRDTMHHKHFQVRTLMRPETFMSTSIQNWSHLQAVLQRV